MLERETKKLKIKFGTHPMRERLDQSNPLGTDCLALGKSGCLWERKFTEELAIG